MKFESFEEVDKYVRFVLEKRYEEYVLNNDTYFYIIELIFQFDGKKIDSLKDKIEIWKTKDSGESKWIDMSFLLEEQFYFESLETGERYGLLSDKNEIVLALNEMYENGELIDLI